MIGFKASKLGEYLRIEHGFAFKGEHFGGHGRHIVLTPGNFYEQGGFKPRPGKDRYYQSTFPPRYVLRKNALIVAMTEQGEGLLGSAAIVPDDDSYLHNQRIGLVQAKAGAAEPRFLYYLFNTTSVRQQIRNSSAGTKIRHTSPERMYGVDVVVPAVPVQRKIAAILSAYDDLIANNQRRITLLERIAEDIYREWFVRLRFPGHEQVEIEKGVPHGWTPSTLGAIADFTMGQSPSSEYFNETGTGLPFHQGVGSYGPRYPRHETFCSVSGRKAKPGDILFSVRAPVGRLNIADQELIIGRGLAAIRHKHGFNAYLLYLLKVAFASEDIIGNGSIFNSVGKDELARLGVFEPSLALVGKFETLVGPIDRQIAALYQGNANLKATRDALLPRLISGKLSVDGLDIQFPPDMSAPA